jgi:peptide/nickel transport system substrate-binding protein
MLLVPACGPDAIEPSATPRLIRDPTLTPEPGEHRPLEEQPTDTADQGPVILRVGATYAPDCWNPFSCAAVWYFGHLVMEGFTDHYSTSDGCKGVPRLAESWEVSEDGRTWTIKLHEGITFSDGTPFTAEAAKWNIEFYSNDPELRWLNVETWVPPSVEVIDELTFSYTTPDSIINSPDYDWVWWYMLNPNVWEEVPEDQLYADEAFPPVGTGPYTVTEHVPGEYIIFDDRPDYYRGDPPIDRVIYTLYSDLDAIVNALLAGEIDMTTPLLPPEEYEPLAGAPDVTVEEKEPYAGGIYWLVFNMYEGGIKNPAIDHPAVREAIDYAVDKEQLVDVVLFGHGVVLPTSWVGVTQTEIAPDLHITPYDPATANQLLDEAGFLDTNGDSVRERDDGTPLEFSLLYQTEPQSVAAMSNMLVAWLQAVGIRVSPEAMDEVSWESAVLEERSFDMAITVTTKDIDPAAMAYWFGCRSAQMGSVGINYPGYCNPYMEDLIYEYWFSSDPEARWEPLYEAQRILADDRPIITLAGQNTIQAFRNDRFDFPFDTCDVAFNMFDAEGLLQAEVK